MAVTAWRVKRSFWSECPRALKKPLESKVGHVIRPVFPNLERYESPRQCADSKLTPDPRNPTPHILHCWIWIFFILPRCLYIAGEKNYVSNQTLQMAVFLYLSNLQIDLCPDPAISLLGLCLSNQCFLNCSRASSWASTESLVRTAASQTPPWTCWIRI